METDPNPRLWSRRKLLASLGMLGAFAAAAGTGAAGAMDAAEGMETGNAASRNRKAESWIDITHPPYNAQL